MKATEQFEKTICAVFGDSYFESILDLYNEVLAATYDPDGTPYGGDAPAIALMRVIREKMRVKGLAPRAEIKLDKKNTLENLLRTRTELLEKNETFRQLFGKTWRYDVEIMNPNDGYDFDGWNYQGIALKPEEWVVKLGKRKPSHLYYNELDHYLTYLVGAIRQNREAADSSRECGLMVLKHEIAEIKSKSECGKNDARL